MLSKKARTVALPAVDMGGEVSMEAGDSSSDHLVKTGGVWASTTVTKLGQRLYRLRDEICSLNRKKSAPAAITWNVRWRRRAAFYSGRGGRAPPRAARPPAVGSRSSSRIRSWPRLAGNLSDLTKFT